MAGVAAIVGAVGSVAGAAAANRNQRRASEAQNRAIEEGAAASDPAAALRPFFQDYLTGNFQNLIGVNPVSIQNDPNYLFQKQAGETAAVNQASAAGLLRSGTLLEDLSSFNQNLASSFVDKQFARNMSILGLLGNYSGLMTGSPSGAGNLITQGGINAAQFGYGANNNTLGNIGGAISQIGRLIPNNSASNGYSSTYNNNNDGNAFAGP